MHPSSRGASCRKTVFAMPLSARWPSIGIPASDEVRESGQKLVSLDGLKHIIENA